jgi:uncharacterized protein YfaT (DUF1175 family)
MALPILPEIAIMSFWPQPEKQILPFSMAKKEISRLTLSDDYWYEPVLTSCSAFVVFSAEEILEVYDSKLKIVKKYKAAGAGSKCMLWPPRLLVMQMHRLAIREEVDGTEVFYMYFRQQENLSIKRY